MTQSNVLGDEICSILEDSDENGENQWELEGHLAEGSLKRHEQRRSAVPVPCAIRTRDSCEADAAVARDDAGHAMLRDATNGDIDEMTVLIREALAAGAFGFSTSRCYGHVDKAKNLVPGTRAAAKETTPSVDQNASSLASLRPPVRWGERERGGARAARARKRVRHSEQTISVAKCLERMTRGSA